MLKLYDHDPNHPDHGGFYARWCNLIRPVATPVLPSFREYPFSEFSDPLVLQGRFEKTSSRQEVKYNFTISR